MTLPRKIKERIRIAYNRTVLRFIPYPDEVRDGTLRCIRCGQIDDEPFHNHALCVAIGGGRLAIYEDDKVYIPIGDEAKDGEPQLVKRGPAYAAAQWTGDFWSYPYDDKDTASCAVQIEFEPTHYWPAPPKELRP